jgi:hypothetical protein
VACHLYSVYKENESKVKLPSFLCWRGAIGSVTDLFIKLTRNKIMNELTSKQKGNLTEL